MGVKLRNPYRAQQGVWLRGSFHGHSSPNSGCASLPLEEGVRRYHDLGADFVVVTDHDTVTGLEQMQAAYPELIFVPGFEHSREQHMVFVGAEALSVRDLSLQEAMARANGLLTFASHPHQRPGRTYWTLDRLRALGRLPDGIEIYNGHYGAPHLRARGHVPQYTGFWDELWTAGCPLWGFANDDLHDPVDLGNAFNVVLARERTPEAIVQAARAGAFYGSTGLRLAQLSEVEGHISVATEVPCTGRFVGPGGRTLREERGDHFEYTATGEAYVRFEAQAAAGQLFLQPMARADGPLGGGPK
jgi:hypothetical protein